MASTTSSTTSFQGVLTDLLVFAAANGWTVESNQNAKNNANPPVDTSWGSATREVILSSTGTSTTETIVVGIREWKYPISSMWGWDLNGYKEIPATLLGWNGNSQESGLTSYAATQQHWSGHPILQLADTTMQYWFTVDPQYIVVTVRISSDYFTCYLGHGKRLTEPSLYPTPVLVAGSNVGSISYQSGGYGPVKANTSTFFCVEGYPRLEYVKGAAIKMYPMQDNINNTNFSETEANEVFSMPSFVLHVADDFALMALDGITAVRRDNLQSEDVITDGADTYIVFQQGSNLSNYNYLAVKQV